MLVRLAGYLERLFQFRSRVDALRDFRARPQIPTKSVWLTVLLMFVLRLRSFNAVEQQLRRKGQWERWVGSRKPSADTLARTLSCFSRAELRALIAEVLRSCWRRKAIHARPGEPYRVVAIDGHELNPSRSRCCPECLTRTITTATGDQIEYYHRVVTAQWVGVSPAAIIDFELMRPGEGEVIAARRLFARIVEQFPRLIDVVTVDALYLEAAFIREVLDAGKHIVVVMKQQARELYQDADRLRALVDPVAIVDGDRSVYMWDLPDLNSFATLGRTVRVVWCIETWTSRRRVAGKIVERQEESQWVWVTDLTPNQVSARRIRRWGHDRWDIENRAFNELSALWHMDHYYVHSPTAIETLLLTLGLAFLVTFLFFERNLKPQFRRHQSRSSLPQLLMDDLATARPIPIWPALSG